MPCLFLSVAFFIKKSLDTHLRLIHKSACTLLIYQKCCHSSSGFVYLNLTKGSLLWKVLNFRVGTELQS